MKRTLRGLILLGGLLAWAGLAFAGGAGNGAFLWGSLLSAHAVEGNHANDWTLWEAQVGHVADGSLSGQACNHWQLFAEDFAWAREKLAHNAILISLEWSRIEPAAGQIDPEALAHYAEVLTAARAAGLRPFVVLWDRTLPQWVAAKGGLMVPATALDFIRFAQVVAKALGDKVDHWLPLRDPVGYAIDAFKDARCPPGMCDIAAYGKAVAILQAMQRGAYEALRRADTADADGDGKACAVGLLHGMTWVMPHNPGQNLDVSLARAQDMLRNLAFLDAVLPRPVPAANGAEGGKGSQTLGSQPPAGAFGAGKGKGGNGSPAPLPPVNANGPLLPKAADFLVVAYGGRLQLKFNVFKPLFIEKVQPPDRVADDLGQVIDPDGLTSVLLGVKRCQVPVYAMVGLADRAGDKREAFLRDHVRQALAARTQGVDLRGFFVDGLLSGFEYQHGFAAKKGLLEVNTAIQERSLAKGAEAFPACVHEESGGFKH